MGARVPERMGARVPERMCACVHGRMGAWVYAAGKRVWGSMAREAEQETLRSTSVRQSRYTVEQSALSRAKTFLLFDHSQMSPIMKESSQLISTACKWLTCLAANLAALASLSARRAACRVRRQCSIVMPGFWSVVDRAQKMAEVF